MTGMGGDGVTSVDDPFADLEPYERRHLVAHLAQAGRRADLHRLMAMETGDGRNAWYETRFRAGDLAGYSIDLGYAQDAAQRSWIEATDAPQRRHALVEEIRCALITVSLNTVASSVPSCLLNSLVTKGVWTLEQAVEFASRRVDWADRLTAMSWLSSLLSDAGRREDLATALELVRGRSGSYRSRSSVQVGAHGDVYVDDEVPDIRDEYLRSQAVVRMAPHLGADLLAVADSIRVTHLRIAALAAVMPHLAQSFRADLVQRALGDAYAIGDKFEQAGALARLLPFVGAVRRHGTGLRRRKLLLSVVSGALVGLEQADHRMLRPSNGLVTSKPHALLISESAEPLEHLAAQCSIAEVRRVLRIADVEDSEDARPYLVRSIFLPRLAALGAVDEAVTACGTLPIPFFRVLAQARIAAYLEPSTRTSMARESLHEVLPVPVADHRAYLLALLAPNLEAPDRHAAVRVTLDDLAAVGMAAFSADIIRRLAGHVPPRDIDRALALAADAAEHDNDGGLATLAPTLTAEQLQQVVQMTEPVTPSRTLTRLRDRIVSGQTPDPESQPPVLLEESFAEALLRVVRDRIGRGSDAAHCLRVLAPHLPAPSLSAARAIAREIVVGDWSLITTACLAVHPRDSPDRAALFSGLRDALYIRDDKRRAAAVDLLVPALAGVSRDHLHHVWTAALRDITRDDRLIALDHLATCGPLVAALGDSGVEDDVSKAAGQVCRWWGRVEAETRNEPGDDDEYTADVADVEPSALQRFARILVEEGQTAPLMALIVCLRPDLHSATTTECLVFAGLASELAEAYRHTQNAGAAEDLTALVRELAELHPDDWRLQRLTNDQSWLGGPGGVP